MRKFFLLVVFVIIVMPEIEGARRDSSMNVNKSFYKRKYTTLRITNIPVIDGKLDDECWKSEGYWSENFIQQLPKEGAQASQATVMKILYDEKNLYVAFICYDTEPDKILQLIGARDQFIGDVVGINFDSYYDHRTGYEFNVTAGGSQIDLISRNEGEPDVNWNAVWVAKTAITDSGWTAELKIPFSQLRYNNKPEQVWGIYAWRWIARTGERVQWTLIPRNNEGFVYNFGEMYGISNLPSSRRIELMPYTQGKLLHQNINKANPLAKEYSKDITFGLDGKIGIGSDFTLDYTINPDFGQVEADPSVMNLSAFETFYDEKRPFFLEGKNILQYNVDDDMLFYSRRIGHSPLKVPSSDEGKQKFVDVPLNTSIIDAVKITGKTNGLSLGVMQSLTAKEYATIDSAGIRYKIPADALTNYMLFRIQKDYNKGNSCIGAILTSTHRDLNHVALHDLTKEAYTGGFDYMQYLFDRNYFFNLKTLASHVKGSSKAISNIQYSSVHYFQRPDANYLKIDTSLQQLNGYGMTLEMGRTSKNKLSFTEQLALRSPGLELNDIGYQQRTDYIQHRLNLRYRETVPSNILREYTIYFENDIVWNFGRQHESTTFLASTWMQFTNKWHFNSWIYHFLGGNDTRFLRGGPSMRMNPYWHYGMQANTDWAKKYTFKLKASYSYDNISNSSDYELAPELFLRLTNRLRFNSKFSYSKIHYDMMYVNTVEQNNNKAYFAARLDQVTYSLTFRANFFITPNISFQYYGSPFITMGNYYNFKLITDPNHSQYNNRFYLINDDRLQYDENLNQYTYTTSIGSFTYNNPDFHVREFRSNFVFRWEFKPGSIFYVVWSKNMSYYDPPYRTSYGSSLKDLFDADGSNIFMLKLNYYFSI